MGTGIAYVAAATGHTVTVVDVQTAQLEKAVANIQQFAADGVRLGKLTADVAAQIGTRVSTQTSLETALKEQPCDLLVESAVELLDVKLDIMRTADRLLPADAIIGTNTSALMVTELAAVTEQPERVVGLHFFNPVSKMKLLEVIRALQTSDATLERAVAWGKALGKTTVVVNDTPGFSTSRISAMVGNEAMYMLMEGNASAEDIDTALRLGLNHPMGPLELGDYNGWDTRLRVLEYLHKTLGEKFRPCPLITKMVKAGHHGRKVGRGVYEWVDGQRVPGSGLKVKV
jgi:3-hydroxybutyryl-CoA dehydrogenase